MIWAPDVKRTPGAEIDSEFSATESLFGFQVGLILEVGL